MLDFTLKNFPIILDYLNDGGIIAVPTDTLYALSCDTTNKKAVEKIYVIKQRIIDKSLPILCKDIKQVEEICIINDIAFSLAEKFWPGALTMILKQKSSDIIASNISKNTTLAVRVPQHELLISLIAAFKKPIIGTSANISGQSNATHAEEVAQLFGPDVMVITDLIDRTQAMHSTIVKVNARDYDIVRYGSVKL